MDERAWMLCSALFFSHVILQLITVVLDVNHFVMFINLTATNRTSLH